MLIERPFAITSSIAAEPRLGRGDLDHQVRLVDRLVQAHRLAEGRERVVGQSRVDLERDVAVAAAPSRPTPGGTRSQASRMSCSASAQKDSSASAPVLDQLGELLVVGVAAGHRLLEDRRVRGRADDRVVVDQLLQVPAADRFAREEVDPDALAERGEALERLGCVGGHGVSLCRSRYSSARARSAMFSAREAELLEHRGARAPRRRSGRGRARRRRSPTQRHQLILAPGSTASRAVIAARQHLARGSPRPALRTAPCTASRRRARGGLRRRASARAASVGPTSAPVAIRISSGSPPGASHST